MTKHRIKFNLAPLLIYLLFYCFHQDKMLKIPDLKIIRVYGDRKEEAEFPIPNRLKPLKSSTDDEDQTHILDEELKAVSLHHVIRGEECPFASELRQYELQFAADRKNDVVTSNTEVDKYCKVKLFFYTIAVRSRGYAITVVQLQLFSNRIAVIRHQRCARVNQVYLNEFYFAVFHLLSN